MDDSISPNSLFENSLNAIGVHTIILDEAGTPMDYIFDSVNQAFEELTGLRREDVLGKSVLTVFPKTERLWIERYGEVALTGVPVTFEARSEELGSQSVSSTRRIEFFNRKKSCRARQSTGRSLRSVR